MSPSESVSVARVLIGLALIISVGLMALAVMGANNIIASKSDPIYPHTVRTSEEMTLGATFPAGSVVFLLCLGSFVSARALYFVSVASVVLGLLTAVYSAIANLDFGAYLGGALVISGIVFTIVSSKRVAVPNQVRSD